MRLMPAGALPLGTRTFQALGSFAILLVTDPEALESAYDLLTAELAAVDAACSRFRSDSELWRVNHARGRRVTISPLFADALAVALAAAAVTDGDVDPTCGQSLVRLGYDRDFAVAPRSSMTPGGTVTSCRSRSSSTRRQPPAGTGGRRRRPLRRRATAKSRS